MRANYFLRIGDLFMAELPDRNGRGAWTYEIDAALSWPDLAPVDALHKELLMTYPVLKNALCITYAPLAAATDNEDNDGQVQSRREAPAPTADEGSSS